MKADEIKATLRTLRGVITNVERLYNRHGEGDSCDIGRLNEIWRELDVHRLELEEAESKPVTAGQIRDADLRQMQAADSSSKCSSCGTAVYVSYEQLCPACHEAAQASPESAQSEAPTLVDVGDLDKRQRFYDLNAHRRLDAIEKRLAEYDAANEPIPDAPERELIAIEMRTHESLSGDGSWTWQCKLGTLWLTMVGADDARYYSNRGHAEEWGGRWLAALREQLGITLVPTWIGNAPPPASG